MTHQRFIKLLIFGGLVLTGAVLSFELTRAATLDLGVNAVNQQIALSAADPRVIIARIIRTALTVLGIIAVLLVLYGGFSWMTSQGEEEKITAAKRILINAAIGLVIVLSAWSITTFILNRLVEATTGRPPAVPRGAVGAPSAALIGFRVQDIRPKDPIPRPENFTGFCRNSVIRVTLTEPVATETVETNVTLRPVGDPLTTSVGFETDGRRLEIRSSTDCPSLPAQKCFEPGRTYRLEIQGGLRSSQPPFRSINCAAGLGASACQAEVTIADCLDLAPPEVSLMTPSSGQSIEPGWFSIRGRASDDQAVGTVEFFSGADSLGFGLLSPIAALTPVDASLEWDTASAAAQSCPILSALATDVDDHETRSSDVPVVIRPAHCFNGFQDEGETGLDCGGQPISVEYCGKCAGEACLADEVCVTACRSGDCRSGVCVDSPRIDNFDPLSAGAGSYVTLAGEFFGSNPGLVTFLGGAGAEDDVVAPLAPCAVAWGPRQIIVQVPNDSLLTAGPIEVRAASGETDRTDDQRGIVANFTPSNILRPGLCLVNPNRGRVGDNLTLSGNGFGESPDAFEFRRRADNQVVSGLVTGWRSDQVQGQVSPLPAGLTEVAVLAGGVRSNSLAFEVLAPETAGQPMITSVTPDQGPPGTYLTIAGANFGRRVGQVIFQTDDGRNAFGRTDFPASCEISFWQNDSIVIKAPAEYSVPQGAIENVLHHLIVRRADNATSDPATFTMTGGQPLPGLCRLEPLSGPETIPVSFFGESFGQAANTLARFFQNVMSGPRPGGQATVSQFDTTVPTGAKTGRAEIQVGAGAAAQFSNPLNFKVQDCREAGNACSDGAQCCGNGACSLECAPGGAIGGYGWYFSTGPIPQVPRLLFECQPDLQIPSADPSPTPYLGRKGGDRVCENALISGRFSIPMDLVTLLDQTNYSLAKCLGSQEPGSNPCLETEAISNFDLDAFLWSDPPQAGLIPRSGHQFDLTPAALESDTWYEVKLRTGIAGSVESGHANLAEDASGCGAGFAYCWRFRTVTGLCALGALNVNPNQFTAQEFEEKLVYTATGRAKDDACIRVNLEAYNFDWSIPEPADLGRAMLLDDDPNVPNDVVIDDDAPAHKATATALSETANNPPNPVDILARVPLENIEDTALLTIDFTDPKVIEIWPNCQTACVNAALGIRFNTQMSRVSLEAPGAASLRKCANENCQVLTDEIALSAQLGPDENNPPNPNRVLRLAPAQNLEPNTFYRVILSGQIESASFNKLSALNYNNNQDYSWSFRTKNSAAACLVSRVDLIPTQTKVKLVGSRVPYLTRPFGSPDECQAAGQELVASSYDWNWSSDDFAVADFLDGMIDTNPSLPLGCSASCRLVGSQGQAGQDAVCGNGQLEETLGEECDDNNAIAGDGCSSRCLREGSAGAAVCGNNLLEFGEDCDDGNINVNDGCSAICLNEGSIAAGSTCGNGSVGLGEDCDDGSLGCSNQCLRLGSHPAPFSLCGNSLIEAGENCDDGNLTSGDGCSNHCLREGQAPCLNLGAQNCCGNGGDPEIREECDDGNLTNNDGCSARCLLEGSSPFYDDPSFCGDGLPLGAGEACEAAEVGGNGLIDASQVVLAVGEGEVDQSQAPPEQRTVISAETGNISGTSPFVIQCGFTEDSQCGDEDHFGVGTNSCCYARPELVARQPAPDEQNVCLNPLIRIDFDQLMRADSFSGRILVAEARATADCLAGETELPETGSGLVWEDRFNFSLVQKGFFARFWENFQAWFDQYLPLAQAADKKPKTEPPAGLGVNQGSWCLTNQGQVSVLRNTNDTETPYDDFSSLFYQITSGALKPQTWYRLRLSGEAAGGSGVSLGQNYEWDFHTGNQICDVDLVEVIDTSTAPEPSLFKSKDEEHIFSASALTERGGKTAPIVPVSGVYEWQWQPWQITDLNLISLESSNLTNTPSLATLKSGATNGETVITASLQIIADNLNNPSTSGVERIGSAEAAVFICENPWPAEGWLEDRVNNDDGLSAPFGNFKTRYCRDAGDEDSVADDLPELAIQNVFSPPSGILKELLLQYVDLEQSRDVIGLRLIDNPRRLSAARWFQLQGFVGAPQTMKVDGYDAVRDGRTVYINAANLVNAGLAASIYILGYNEGASPETINIFEQLLANLRFNINFNLTQNNGLCFSPVLQALTDQRCSSDFDCSIPSICLAMKDKVRRDTLRLEDLRDIEAVLANYRAGKGSYPQLGSGTFVPGMSVSAWPSWFENLSKEIGAALPIDPLNKFADCGQGFDSVTCFAQQVASGCPGGSCYRCPWGSAIYEYRAIGPQSYELRTDLESSESLANVVLEDGAWTAITSFPPNPEVKLRGVQVACSGQVIGASARCGDGVRSAGEVCELGETSFLGCSLTGPGGQVAGQQAAICQSNCSGFVFALNSICQAAVCGNGVREGTCQGGNKNGQYCRLSADCPSGICNLIEVCDDGANNGHYGFCATNCGVGVANIAAYCGDETLAGPEVCDCGQVGFDANLPGNCSARNGQYNNLAVGSCALDCRGLGPYCGDGVVQSGNEECDGDLEVGRGRCADGSNVCDSNEDCPSNVACQFCPNTPPTATGLVYPQILTRTCQMAAGACDWNAVPALASCAPQGICGNNQKEGNEQCDDGPDTPNDECANTCRLNICGDGIPWLGVEACDLGALPGGQNGVPCSAPYGSTCNYCSTSCTYLTAQGPFCGDKIYTSGPERCDYSANPIVTSGSLPSGYDPVLSLCDQSCDYLCPPDYSSQPIAFGQIPEPGQVGLATYSVSLANEQSAALIIPACRLSGGLVADVILDEDILQFPSPLEIIFIIDTSESMGPVTAANQMECDPNHSGLETRIQCVRRALNGVLSDHSDGALARLFASRSLGEVRIGLVEVNSFSQYRSWGGSLNSDKEECQTDVSTRSPCDTICEYGSISGQLYADYCEGISIDPPSIGLPNSSSGLLNGSEAEQADLRGIIQGLSPRFGNYNFLAFRQAKAILNNTAAGSRVIIFISDGPATDCCAPFSSSYCKVDPARDGYCAVVNNQCAAPSGNAACRWTDGEAPNKPNDGITIFTVSFPALEPTIQGWADQAPAGSNFSYAYSGADIGQMLDNIISTLGAVIEISPNSNFSSSEVTGINTSGFGLPLSSTQNYCQNQSRNIYLRSRFQPLSQDAKVQISNVRWSYCPLQ